MGKVSIEVIGSIENLKEENRKLRAEIRRLREVIGSWSLWDNLRAEQKAELLWESIPTSDGVLGDMSRFSVAGSKTGRV